MRAVERDVDTTLPTPKAADRESPATDSSTRNARGAGSPSIWRRVRRDVALLAAGSVGNVVAQLIFRSILIAVLVPAGYGRLSLILSIYNTVWIIGASGLPNGVARYIAVIAPGDDSAIVRSAIRAGVWPTVVAAALVATASGVILASPLAFLYGATGVSCLVYAFIITGILRGRGQVGAASSVMPISGVGEVSLLAVLVISGFTVTPLSAFGVFCLGNVIGLLVGISLTMRTAPRRVSTVAASHALVAAPSTRQLLGFSMWLGAATVGIAILPLVVRSAAALDSYTVVAIVDVALVLLSIPVRMGAVLVAAVVPHATRALTKGDESLTISRREQMIVIVPFVLAAILVVFTPVVGLLFDSLGRHTYAKSADYLGLALLAGPARVLYGLVEGVLVAHGEGRFLAFNSLSVTAAAAGAIMLAAALGEMVLAFSLFVVACWAVYVCGLKRIRRLAAADKSLAAEA